MRPLFARLSWLVVGLSTLTFTLVPSAATPQFVSISGNSHNILEGNWQSCQETSTGGYAERVYDHVVNGVPQFEVHLGPRREFAIFTGVQDEHREHDSDANLLKPFRVLMEGEPREAALGNSVVEAGVLGDARRRLAHRLRELVHPSSSRSRRLRTNVTYRTSSTL